MYAIRSYYGDVIEADGGQQRFAEAVLVRQIIPLAGQRADAGDVRLGETPGQVVGKIEEAPCGGVTFGKVLLEP